MNDRVTAPSKRWQSRRQLEHTYFRWARECLVLQLFFFKAHFVLLKHQARSWHSQEEKTDGKRDKTHSLTLPHLGSFSHQGVAPEKSIFSFLQIHSERNLRVFPGPVWDLHLLKGAEKHLLKLSGYETIFPTEEKWSPGKF